MGGKNKNAKNNATTIIIVIVVVVAILNSGGLHCAAQDLTQCTKCVGPNSRCNSDSMYASCCEVLYQITKSNSSTETADLICDAVIKNLKPDNQDTARDFFTLITSDCNKGIKDNVLFDSASQCKQLPTMAETLPAKCLTFLQNKQTQNKNDRIRAFYRLDNVSPCCTGLVFQAHLSGCGPSEFGITDSIFNPRVFCYNAKETTAAVCNTLQQISLAQIGKKVITANEAFDTIANTCDFRDEKPDFKNCDI